jgi:hypothetical protein
MKHRHFNEWRASSVTAAIINANVESMDADPEVFDPEIGSPILERLAGGSLTALGSHGQQYTTKAVKDIQERYRTVIKGGWWVSGLDPLNNWQRSEWGQFKPDQPRLDYDNKLLKYEAPAKTAPRAIFLDTGKPDFWPNAIANQSPLVITEGAKKAGALLSAGFAAVALVGINAGYRVKDDNGNETDPYLCKDLEFVVKPGQLVYLAFDQDSKPATKRKVAHALIKLGRLLEAKGATVKVVSWPARAGKGVDDFIAGGGDIHQAINQAQPLPKDGPMDLLTLEQVKQQLQRLTMEGVKETEIQIAIAELAKASGNHPHAIKAIYQAIAAEANLSAAVSVAGADLAQLQSVKGIQLPIEAGLYGDGGVLARKLRQVAEAMPTAPEFLITTLIPVLATAMGTAQTLVIHATAGYKAVPIFRSIIVAQTGRKKTPAQAAILGALTQLEQSAAADHDIAVADYELEHREWLKASKGSDDPGPEPKKPTRQRYMTQDSTLAARIQIHSDNPRGLLLYKDEASAFITERGRFSSGKGDGGEFEADLSEFNGGAIMTDRKGDGSTFLAKSAISRVGATQYSTLQRLMGSHDDDCGEFARYLFCAAEAPPSKLDLSKDVGDIGLTSDVMRVFTALSELPEQAYLLSPEAKRVFQAYQHELTDRQIAEDHPSLQSAYPKFETYFGRFVLWLHLVNAALAEQTPAATVDGYTVELARQWTEYYIAQLRLVLAVNSPQQELTGDLLRVYEYLKRKDKPLDFRAISQGRLFARSADKAKQQSAYLKELLNSLVEQRWIVEQDGHFLLNMLNIPTEQGFQPPVEPIVEHDVEQMLSSVQHTQSHSGQGFQPPDEHFVEQLSNSGNKKPDNSQPLTEDQLINLIDLISSDREAFRNQAAKLGEGQRLQLIKEIPWAEELIAC